MIHTNSAVGSHVGVHSACLSVYSRKNQKVNICTNMHLGRTHVFIVVVFVVLLELTEMMSSTLYKRNLESRSGQLYSGRRNGRAIHYLDTSDRSNNASGGSISPDWMSDIDDEKMLRELSIPGSHDTMAINGFPISNAQIRGGLKKIGLGGIHAGTVLESSSFINFFDGIESEIKKEFHKIGAQFKNGYQGLKKTIEKGYEAFKKEVQRDCKAIMKGIVDLNQCIISGDFILTLGNPALCLAAKLLIAGYTTTQDLTLRDQYEAGVRVIDIRCGMPNKDEGCDVYHETIDLSVTLREVLETTKEFLFKYPSEFILMAINHEGGAGGNRTTIQRTIKKLLARSTYRKLFAEGNTNDFGATELGSLRGKIVIYTNFDISPTPNVGKAIKFALANNSYEGVGISTKIKLIKENLDNATIQSPAEFYKIDMNYAGTNGENVKEILLENIRTIGPRYHANQINPAIFNYLSIHKVKRTGLVMMDFVTKEYAQQIIRVNYR